MKPPALRIVTSAGSGSAWLIFGLAVAVVLGILAWPKIQEASRKAKMDTVASVVRTYRLACLSYYGRNGTYPIDGQEGIQDGTGEYLRLEDGRILDPANTTFGDILVQKGYLPPLTFPVDNEARSVAIRALSAEVLVRKLGPGILFASAPTATRVVILSVPDLSSDSGAKLVEIFQQEKAGLPGGGGKGEIPTGDCRLWPHPDGEKADAFIYLAHE